ncbi:hypothetical protein ILUMI_10398 [Ignelater luminosus]|uniref:Uncharacterized protein n=1 Tax=Ignelater luminosus TaxID=2038154 RepID=A0A8K0D0I0_IGNLU|nr:hypothetical protein ILUMI_10398 [Ignelater luminosus]
MESGIKAEDTKDCMMPLSPLTKQEEIPSTGDKQPRLHVAFEQTNNSACSVDITKVAEDAHTELMRSDCSNNKYSAAAESKVDRCT